MARFYEKEIENKDGVKSTALFFEHVIDERTRFDGRADDAIKEKYAAEHREFLASKTQAPKAEEAPKAKTGLFKKGK